MSEQDLRVIEAMEKYGGSFVKALANLARESTLRDCITKAWRKIAETGIPLKVQ